MSRPLFARIALPLTLSLTLLAGCSKEASVPVPTLDKAERARAASIAHPAWLRERLPEHTVAYLRVPSLWGWMSAPNGRALDHALASEAHLDAINQLRTAVRKDPLLADSGFAPMLGLLLADLSSPVEFAVVDGSDIANPASNFFGTVQLDIADVATMNARIAALAGDTPLLNAPLDAEGRGEFSTGGFMRFDAASRRLYVHAGMAASAVGLDALIQQTAQTRPAEMAESEKAVDSSGQGLFFWIKLKGVNGMAGAYLPQDARSALVRDFVQKSESFTAGWGTVDGHGRLQMRLRAPQAKLLGYFTPKAQPPLLKTAGKPQWAATFNLPDAAQWQTLLNQMDTDFGPGTRARFDQLNGEVATRFGIAPIEVMRRIGPAVVGFEDAAGTYSALQTSDRKGLYAVIDAAASKHGWRHETLRLGNADVHHLMIPGASLEDATKDSGDAQLHAWARLYGRIGSHLYWIEDGDWLVFGSVPQALADRATAPLDTRLSDWQQAQGYDASGSLLGVSAQTRNVQRTSYYAYIGGLQMAADLFGASVDLARLPSASQLKLPTEGSTGIALEGTPEHVGLSLMYDATPLDALSGGGSMATVATAAILAAVALPAYQDYVARSQVASVVAATGPLKAYVSDHYVARGAFPDGFDDTALEESHFGEVSKYLEDFHLDDGSIVLQFGDEAAASLHDQILVISPFRADGDLIWHCGDAALPETAEPMSDPDATTTMPTKTLPAGCR